jgi:hydrogenase maturation protease
MNGKVLVAGIGNIFLGDDAFGVVVVQHLAARPLPEGVKVVDFGIRSYDLAYALMNDWDLVILVDALPGEGKPGTLYIMEPELLSQGETPASLDAHTMDPIAVLHMVSALGGKVGRMLVVGCEPASVEPDESGEMSLTAPVKAAVDEAARMVEELIVRERSHATAA